MTNKKQISDVNTDDGRTNLQNKPYLKKLLGMKSSWNMTDEINELRQEFDSHIPNDTK